MYCTVLCTVQYVLYVVYVQYVHYALYSDGCGMGRGMGWKSANQDGDWWGDTAGGWGW